MSEFPALVFTVTCPSIFVIGSECSAVAIVGSIGVGINSHLSQYIYYRLRVFSCFYCRIYRSRYSQPLVPVYLLQATSVLLLLQQDLQVLILTFTYPSIFIIGSECSPVAIVGSIGVVIHSHLSQNIHYRLRVFSCCYGRIYRSRYSQSLVPVYLLQAPSVFLLLLEDLQESVFTVFCPSIFIIGSECSSVAIGGPTGVGIHSHLSQYIYYRLRVFC